MSSDWYSRLATDHQTALPSHQVSPLIFPSPAEQVNHAQMDLHQPDGERRRRRWQTGGRQRVGAVALGEPAVERPGVAARADGRDT